MIGHTASRTLVASTALLTVAFSALPAHAEDLTDPTEILKKVDAAAKAVKAVKYEATFEAKGAEAGRAPKLTFTYMFDGRNGVMPQRMWIEAKGTRPDSSDPIHVVGGGDGDTHFLIDHTTKKAYEDMDPEVMGSARRFLFAGIMVEFVHETPFTDELTGKKRELKGSKTIAGEDCYEIHVTYANDQQAKWWFSKKDFLPRARWDIDTGRGGGLKTITKLTIDPKFSADTFKLKLPEGYEKIDDFAP